MKANAEIRELNLKTLLMIAIAITFLTAPLVTTIVLWLKVY